MHHIINKFNKIRGELVTYKPGVGELWSALFGRQDQLMNAIVKVYNEIQILKNRTNKGGDSD